MEPKMEQQQWKQRAAAAVILFMLLAGAAATMTGLDVRAELPAAYSAEEQYAHSRDAVVYLRVLREDGSLKATGTGTVLTAEGLAATAYHVVQDAERIEAVFLDGRVLAPVEVEAHDAQTDAAILRLPAPTEGGVYDALPLRGPAVRYGERVAAVGYPLAYTPIITEGIVNSPEAAVNGRNRILTSAQIASGMSGGPLLDAHGRVAGIVSGSLRTINNVHLVIAADDIRALLPEDSLPVEAL